MSHILIAYERESDLTQVEKLLSARGHTIARATTGLEALDSARREPPDLVISDVVLPQMDGVALCRKWKQDERLHAIPFVFHPLRYNDPKYERFAAELGAELFLPGTMRPETVQQAIADLLSSAPAPTPAENTATAEVVAMTNTQALVREKQLRTQLAELETTAKRLATGEAQFRALFDDSPAALFIVDTASNGFIAVNAAALTLYGHTRSEFLQLTRNSLAATQVRDSDRDVTWHVRKDGRRLPVAVTASPIQFGGRAAELTCVQDISESFQHAHNLQAQLNLQRNLLDAIPGGWCLIDREGHLLDANEVYCRMSGYERDALLRMQLKDLQVDSNGSSGEFEAQHRRRDGSLYAVDVRTQAFRDAAGVETGAQIFLIQEPSARSLALLTAQHRAQRETMDYALLSSALLDEHDVYSRGSGPRVAQLAVEIAREMGLSAAQCERIRVAGLLHDVGMLGVPASLLSNPSEFTAAEATLVEAHAATGARMLARLSDPRIAEIVHQHHERVNGSGYPRQLKSDAIAIEARVLAVADVVESICSPRAHRPALGMDAALSEVENNAGVLFDSVVVTAALRLLREQQFAFAA